jgi:ribose transport system substrate-binding protein
VQHRRLLATCAAVLVLAACTGEGSQSPSGPSGSGASPGLETAGPSASGSASVSGKLGISYALLDSPFMTLLDGLIVSGAQAAGLEPLPALNAALDVTKQATDIKNLITQEVAAIIAMPIDTAAIVSSLDDAAEANIPVVVFDTLPDSGSVFMSVRADNIEMGATACKSLGDLIEGTGTVAEIQGDLASIAGRERSSGFEDCMAKDYPNVTIVKVPAVWDPGKAASGLEAILTSEPDLAGIYIHSGGGYLAPTLQVLERKNRLFAAGDPNHMPLVSIDGEPAELDAIRSGFLDSTVSQPADLYGSLSVFYAAKAVEGATFAPGPTDHGSTIVERPGGILEDSLPSTFVTKDNVDDPTLWANAAS